MEKRDQRKHPVRPAVTPVIPVELTGTNGRRERSACGRCDRGGGERPRGELASGNCCGRSACGERASSLRVRAAVGEWGRELARRGKDGLTHGSGGERIESNRRVRARCSACRHRKKGRAWAEKRARPGSRSAGMAAGQRAREREREPAAATATAEADHVRVGGSRRGQAMGKASERELARGGKRDRSGERLGVVLLRVPVGMGRPV
jgi:hypothetical protein